MPGRYLCPASMFLVDYNVKYGHVAIDSVTCVRTVGSGYIVRVVSNGYCARSYPVNSVRPRLGPGVFGHVRHSFVIGVDCVSVCCCKRIILRGNVRMRVNSGCHSTLGSSFRF